MLDGWGAEGWLSAVTDRLFGLIETKQTFGNRQIEMLWVMTYDQRSLLILRFGCASIEDQP